MMFHPLGEIYHLAYNSINKHYTMACCLKPTMHAMTNTWTSSHTTGESFNDSVIRAGYYGFY